MPTVLVTELEILPVKRPVQAQIIAIVLKYASGWSHAQGLGTALRTKREDLVPVFIKLQSGDTRPTRQIQLHIESVSVGVPVLYAVCALIEFRVEADDFVA